jgi:hypothetical protein
MENSWDIEGDKLNGHTHNSVECLVVAETTFQQFWIHLTDVLCQRNLRYTKNVVRS